jgi:peptide/nickel transport system permease protein
MTDLAPPPVSRPGLVSQILPGFRLRIGVLVTLVLLLAGFVSIVWTPYPVELADPVAQMEEPSAAHLLGTDAVGRDILSMTMKGILTSFVVAGVATAIGLFVGVPLGAAAARWGVWAERILLGGTGFLVSVSALGIAVILTALLGPSALNAMLAIGLFNTAVIARATRDELMAYRGLDYVAASRLAGLGGWELVRRHILPAFLPILASIAVTQLALGVLLEAGLSFVGLASQPPGSSLGLMLREAQSVMLFEPLIVVIPGLVLLLITLALNLIASGLRDQFVEARHVA